MNINLVQANHGFGENGGGDVEEVPQGLKPAVILHHFRHVTQRVPGRALTQGHDRAAV